jgi:hypothetical protein
MKREAFDFIFGAEERDTIERGNISRISESIRSLLISDPQSALNYNWQKSRKNVL